MQKKNKKKIKKIQLTFQKNLKIIKYFISKNSVYFYLENRLKN